MNPYSNLRIYLAAPFEERPVMLELKKTLEDAGAVITSTWLTPDDSLSMNQLHAKSNRHYECWTRAQKDFEDIDAAHVLVLWKPKSIHKKPTTGGHHVEVGYALAKGKPVFVVGERENVFHFHHGVREVSDVFSLIHALHLKG